MVYRLYGFMYSGYDFNQWNFAFLFNYLAGGKEPFLTSER